MTELNVGNIAYTSELTDFEIIADLNQRFGKYVLVESDDESEEYEVENTKRVKDHQHPNGGTPYIRREPKTKGNPYSSKRDGLGKQRLLTPTEQDVFWEVVKRAGYRKQSINYEATVNWWKFTFSRDREFMRTNLFNVKLRDFNPKTSRLSSAAQANILEARNKLLKQNPRFFETVRDNSWNYNLYAQELKKMVEAGGFSNGQWEYNTSAMWAQRKIKTAQMFKKRSTLNGNNGEATNADDISENQFNVFLGQYNTAVRATRATYFTQQTVDGSLVRQYLLVLFDMRENEHRYNILQSLRRDRSFVAAVGTAWWAYDGDTIKQYRSANPPHTDPLLPFYFTNLHNVPSELNGAQGEVTGTDDMAPMIPPCESNPCLKTGHYHKKTNAKAFEGAEKRMSEKVKICKPSKIEDLVVCEEEGCQKSHYHITPRDKSNHAEILAKVRAGNEDQMVTQAQEADRERQEGEEDGQDEYEETLSGRLVQLGNERKPFTVKLINLLTYVVNVRYPIKKYGWKYIVLNNTMLYGTTIHTITHKEVPDVAAARVYVDIQMQLIEDFGYDVGEDGALASMIPEYEVEKRPARQYKGVYVFEHLKIIDTEYPDDMVEGALVNMEKIRITPALMKFPSVQSYRPIEEEELLNKVPVKAEDNSTPPVVSPAPVVVYKPTLPEVGNQLIIGPVQQEYSVGGWVQKSVKGKTVYEKREAFAVDDYLDLMIVEVHIAHRNHRWFQWYKDFPKWANGLCDNLEHENPHYYGKDNKVYSIVSKSLMDVLLRTRMSARYSEAVVASIWYQATMEVSVGNIPPYIAYSTFLQFVERWVLLQAQNASLQRNNKSFLDAKKVPMRIPQELSVVHSYEQARRHMIPAGVYHQNTDLPIHLPHIQSAYFGTIDDNIMSPNKRWRLRKTSGGASFSNGYVHFPTTWFKDTYESLYCAFPSKVGVIQPSTRELEKIVLRLTMEKTPGVDEKIIALQQKAFNHPAARDWLAFMGDKHGYPDEIGFVHTFLDVYRDLCYHPTFDNNEFIKELTAYTLETGIKVAQRLAVIDEITICPHQQQKEYNEVAFKPDENQKIKVKDGYYFISYARAFIALPGHEWAASSPHLISRFKDKFSHTVLWTKHGMISQDGYQPTPNLNQPWRHTNCLYPIYTESGVTHIQVEEEHLASVIGASIRFAEMTKGLATVSHGDDIWAAMWNPVAGKVQFIEADIVANDISHTQFAFAMTAMTLAACGVVVTEAFKQMQRDVRIRNGPFRRSWVQLATELGFNLPTGSGLTTSHNTMIAMLICYAMCVYGPDAAADQIGYTLEMKKTFILSQSTFLAHYFYVCDDGEEVDGGECYSAAQCPSVWFRGMGKTRGDFPSLPGKKESVRVKGKRHVDGVVKGLVNQDSNPISDAFRSWIPTPLVEQSTNKRAHASRSQLARDQQIQALVQRAGQQINYHDVVLLGEQIRSMTYGSVVVSPLVDALLLVRYGVPPTAV